MERVAFQKPNKLDKLRAYFDITIAYGAVFFEGFMHQPSFRLDRLANMDSHIKNCQRCTTIQFTEKYLDSNSYVERHWNDLALRAIYRHIPKSGH